MYSVALSLWQNYVLLVMTVVAMMKYWLQVMHNYVVAVMIRKDHIFILVMQLFLWQIYVVGVINCCCCGARSDLCYVVVVVPADRMLKD